MIRTDGNPTYAMKDPTPVTDVSHLLETLTDVDEANAHRARSGQPRVGIKMDLEAYTRLRLREAHLHDAMEHALDALNAPPAKRTARERRVMAIIEASLLSYSRSEASGE